MGSKDDNAYWDDKYACDESDCTCGEGEDPATEVELEDTGKRRTMCEECGIRVGHIVGCPNANQGA